jgi:hypothetical protein
MHAFFLRDQIADKKSTHFSFAIRSRAKKAYIFLSRLNRGPKMHAFFLRDQIAGKKCKIFASATKLRAMR